ncbi:segregation/condensation protein A [bacterium]|nr:segregation/condensation protein A [bacterium]
MEEGQNFGEVSGKGAPISFSGSVSGGSAVTKAPERKKPLVALEGMFTVETEHFFGPVDLLLHLVKKNELEIEKISLAYVADQYVACLENMKKFDLEIAGEYLVIASTLVSIKSSVMLAEPVELELDDEGNFVDPHERLLLQLKEAAVYQEGAAMLAELPMYGTDVFAPPPSLSDFPAPPETYREHDPYLLGVAFRKVLQRDGEGEPKYEITLDTVSIVDQMMSVLDLLKGSSEALSFESLVESSVMKASEGDTVLEFRRGGPYPRQYVVGTFVALLELCKRQVITVSQKEDEIVVGLAGQVGSDEQGLGSIEEFDSEFDEPSNESGDTESAVNE